MNETQDLGQRYIATLWDALGSFPACPKAASEQLAGLVTAVQEIEAQLAGLKLHLLQEAKLMAADAVLEDVRQSVRTTSAQATASLRLAADLADRFPLIGAALNEGTISLPQAEAIVAGLRKLPARFTREDVASCQASILEHVDALGPAELRQLATRLAEVIDPEGAEAQEAQRLAAEERAAHRNRFLRLSPDFHGSVRITGQLPTAEAALLSAQLDALMPPASSYTDSGHIPSRDARRADALVLLTQTAANSGELPAHGTDRPHVYVTMSYDALVSGLGRVELPGLHGTDGISASEARHLACDAGIIPMVLGSASQPLDVGREHRHFTPAIRAALTHRDQGCAFPHCTATPASCEAHHIIPWWAGGASSLSNGVLLCPHHHRLVEPDPLQSAESQWEVRLDPDSGLPWFTPPRHIDPRRRPRQHPRHRIRHLEAPPCPAGLRPSGQSPDEARLEERIEELIQRSAAAWHPEAG